MSTSTHAMKIFADLPEVLQAYIMSRGGKYGIDPHEVLMKVPQNLHDNPLEIYRFIRSKHISHRIPTSEGGDPRHSSNWIFEDGSINSARQDDVMHYEDYLDAQIDNTYDAMAIEFGTPDPGNPFYNAAYSQAFGGEGADIPDMTAFGDSLTGTLENHISEGVSNSAENMFMHYSDTLFSSVTESLVEAGIPIAYVGVKGFHSALPFLKSVNWARFRSESRYRMSVMARALKAFREGGWKVVAKAFVMGYLIASFPPLAYFVAAIGLTGVAALGTRWLAAKVFKHSGPIAKALDQIADTLESVHKFLKNVLDSFERVIEVAIQAATSVVKRVVTVGSEFARSVYETSSYFATEAVAATSKALASATKATKKMVSEISSQLSGWIFSWYGRPGFG